METSCLEYAFHETELSVFVLLSIKFQRTAPQQNVVVLHHIRIFDVHKPQPALKQDPFILIEDNDVKPAKTTSKLTSQVKLIRKLVETREAETKP